MIGTGERPHWTGDDDVDEWIAGELARAPLADDDPEACRRIMHSLMSAEIDAERV